ncbi:MAG: GNAT family N-acetyltransferase [Eubacterium sp.]|nr:GNAT family N-acetyltransferase [Eubacterium sp.]MDE6469972.1 GNAT family N-acetyltransferase [Eubacterium sp.]
MKIIEIENNKKEYLPLLLLGDEQEDMIDKYINHGRMFVLCDNEPKAVCVITDEGNGILEIKNIAVAPNAQRQGYGKKIIEFISENFKDKYSILQAGTGDSPLTVPFYENCGFKRAFKIKNFFTDNYDHPIIENGVQLVDMIYFQKKIQ